MKEEVKAYLAFSPRLKNARAFADQFDAGINSLKKSGELMKIRKKYGVSTGEYSKWMTNGRL